MAVGGALHHLCCLTPGELLFNERHNRLWGLPVILLPQLVYERAH